MLDHIAACVGLRAGSHPSSPRSVSNCVTGAGQNTVPVGEGVRLAVGLAMNVCELVEVAAELVVPLGDKPDVSDGVDDPLANGDTDARAALTLNVCTRSPLSVKCFKREPAAEKSCNRAPVDRAAASARLKYTMEDKTKEAPRSTDLQEVGWSSLRYGGNRDGLRLGIRCDKRTLYSPSQAPLMSTAHSQSNKLTTTHLLLLHLAPCAQGRPCWSRRPSRCGHQRHLLQ